MPPRRGASLYPASPPTSPMDDLTGLSLPDIQARLERNARVLNLSFFTATVPVSPPLTSSPNPAPLGNTNDPSPSLGTSPTDPVRDRLLEMRQRLLAREQELRAAVGGGGGGGGEGEGAESSGQALARRRSEEVAVQANGFRPAGGGAAMGGKARALQRMRDREEMVGAAGVALPISETLALNDRDYTDYTSARLSHLSLRAPSSNSKLPATANNRHHHRPHLTAAAHDRSSRSPSFDPTDEIARAQAQARMREFLTYRPNDDEDMLDDGAEDDGFFEEDWGEGEYDGEGGRLEIEHRNGRREGRLDDVGGGGRGGTGEDGGEWEEGNEEYAEDRRGI